MFILSGKASAHIFAHFFTVLFIILSSGESSACIHGRSRSSLFCHFSFSSGSWFTSSLSSFNFDKASFTIQEIFIIHMFTTWLRNLNTRSVRVFIFIFSNSPQFYHFSLVLLSISSYFLYVVWEMQFHHLFIRIWYVLMLSNYGRNYGRTMVALWSWRRLLRVPWTARRSNQSILREISPDYSLEGLMLKWKLQYFDHLMRRALSLEKTLMLGKIKGGRRRGRQMVGWHHWLNGHETVKTGKPGVLQSMGHKESDMT